MKCHDLLMRNWWEGWLACYDLSKGLHLILVLVLSHVGFCNSRYGLVDGTTYSLPFLPYNHFDAVSTYLLCWHWIHVPRLYYQPVEYKFLVWLLILLELDTIFDWPSGLQYALCSLTWRVHASTSDFLNVIELVVLNNHYLTCWSLNIFLCCNFLKVLDWDFLFFLNVQDRCIFFIGP